jgi:hypothetical protein
MAELGLQLVRAHEGQAAFTSRGIKDARTSVYQSASGELA